MSSLMMPGEWAPQAAVWMIWPYRPDNWRNKGAPAQTTFSELARLIAKVTPVYMAVPAEHMYKARAIMPSDITLVAIESDDAWARDTGPTVVLNAEGERVGINWVFNAWGGTQGGLYESWSQDQAVAGAMLAQHAIPKRDSPLILEGGAIHVDGEGTLLTTKECLLNSNRNPNWSQAEIEQELSTQLGVSHFIWLPKGVYLDETDGHIDNMACFARPGEVILHWCDDQADPQYDRSQAAYQVLSQARDAKGRALKIWKLPQPGPLTITDEEASGVQASTAQPRIAGERMAGSYVNFLITNNRLIYPLLDAKTDNNAHQLLEEIFPELEIIGLPAREILLGGGNIHCITQQIPAARKI
ncbi:agmatine deiminase [Oceanisphaera avium]|uniref:Putative agmatine deiminase n=1 Tax=Oceanisphaera avium TaxID=1903694 RepID=A0A1Y0CW27_9GAMM|nr:agmatine deiminase [Oceanisphaera avium]ART79439.1 agmatine deiminase [Oceanisphaera avium]